MDNVALFISQADSSVWAGRVSRRKQATIVCHCVVANRVTVGGAGIFLARSCHPESLSSGIIPNGGESRSVERGRGTVRVMLIVEDDREMRSLLCDGLWDLGLSIREAADGDEALRVVLESCPDLIITDLRMPAGGLDYVARLRTFVPQAPIILMTSFGDAQTKAEALALGVSAYFDKPLRMSELRAKVQEILGPFSVPLS